MSMFFHVAAVILCHCGLASATTPVDCEHAQTIFTARCAADLLRSDVFHTSGDIAIFIDVSFETNSCTDEADSHYAIHDDDMLAVYS